MAGYVPMAGGALTIPMFIFRVGDWNRSNLTPRPQDGGKLSFRTSLNNPVGQPPVFRAGKPYIQVDTARLPPDSVVVDNDPPGHAYVVGVDPHVLRAAVVARGTFPGDQ